MTIFAQQYRPLTFRDLVGQKEIVQTLQGALQSGQIAPAYLFTGIRGTGKTSSARIFAKALNCSQADKPTPTPCGVCDQCQAIARSSSLDVIEIDAASNTGVENIRDLIERSQFVPLQGRYKVFVIDEAHMLSKQALNAMLKTLEEPPSHVVFILATTDPQQLLDTILSRCQRFDFRSISPTVIAEALKQIADREGIDVTPEALAFMAQRARGGLRDATNLLEQAKLLGAITLETLYRLVGALPEAQLLSLVTLFVQPDTNATATALDLCDTLLQAGHKPLTVLEGLVQVVTDLQIALQAPTRPDLVTYTALWDDLCRLSHGLYAIQLQMLGNQLRAANDLIRYSEQGPLWLKRVVLDLLAVEAVDVPPARQSLGQQWQSVIEHLPVGLKPLLDQGQLLSLEGEVATVQYPNTMLTAIAKTQTTTLEKAFQEAGYGVVKVSLG